MAAAADAPQVLSLVAEPEGTGGPGPFTGSEHLAQHPAGPVAQVAERRREGPVGRVQERVRRQEGTGPKCWDGC